MNILVLDMKKACNSNSGASLIRVGRGGWEVEEPWEWRRGLISASVLEVCRHFYSWQDWAVG